MGQASEGRGSPSPPTDRALDVIELLARRTTPIRLADLGRDLGITTATAHAVVTTLCERGWAVRNPHTKAVSLGPGLERAAATAVTARPTAHALRLVADELADEFGFDASVTERAGDSLVLTYYVALDRETTTGAMGDRIPFTAPFGAGFAAWAPDTDQRAWVEQTARDNAALGERLEQVLTATRARGFSLERMTPTLARTLQLVDTLGDDRWAQDFRRVVEDAMLEMTTTDTAPVFGIVAPVLDDHGIAVFNVGVHPYRTLPAKRLERVGTRVAEAARSIRA
ncbi:MAG: helix-turn-helix domain-containing protein [Acidimicrobiia bacterium]